jgi:hypothetical protein
MAVHAPQIPQKSAIGRGMACHALRIVAFIQRLKLFGISEIANIIKVLFIKFRGS